MDDTNTSKQLLPRELPRRLRLSAREIGVAIALTLAAAAQIWASLGARDQGSMGRAVQADRSQASTGSITAR